MDGKVRWLSRRWSPWLNVDGVMLVSRGVVPGCVVVPRGVMVVATGLCAPMLLGLCV